MKIPVIRIILDFDVILYIIYLGLRILSPELICPSTLRKDRSTRREVDDPKKEDSDYKSLFTQVKTQKKWLKNITD